MRSLLLRALADIVRNELDDPRLEAVSFCDLTLSRDLSYADVKVAAGGGIDASKQCAAALNSAAPLLWNRLRSETDLRTIPKLRFHVDRGQEYVDQIERIIQTFPATTDAGVENMSGDSTANNAAEPTTEKSLSIREQTRREEEEYISTADRARLIDEIGTEWGKAKTVWIFTHEAPDGDALGCNLAVLSALRSMGKDVTVFSYDVVPRMYRFLPLAENIVHTLELPPRLPDLIQVNDTATFERLGVRFAEQLTKRGVGSHARERNLDCMVINIDHHIGNGFFGNINLVDPGCGACGELLYHTFMQLEIPITRDMAVNLYAAVMTDTGRFSYGNTDSDTFHVTSELIRAGADPYDVASRVYHTRTISQMRLLAEVMQTIHAEPELGYFTVICTQEMLEQTGTLLSDTEGITDLIKTVNNFEMTFFLKEESDGNVKVSVRSDGNFDVRKLASRLGGGGHPAASGFRMHVPIADAKQVLAEEVMNYRVEISHPVAANTSLSRKRDEK